MRQPAGLQIANASWFKRWFDSPFYHALYANRNDFEATSFVDNLVAELKPVESASMLDLGCGAGRHAKRLSEKGFNVTGLDLAPSSIRIAKRSETPGLRFHKHDMRVPFGKNCFDYVFNFFTSFGYFKTDKESYQVVNNISRSLVDGGVLVMDYLNVDFAESNLVVKEHKEIDGVNYQIDRWTDARFFYKKITIGDLIVQEPLVHIEQVAKFRAADFDLMFKRNGLRMQKIVGDYELSDYDCQTSPRLILIAQKTK